jgi:hypothetical protein
MDAPVDREDVLSIMVMLMRMDEKLVRVLDLLEDDGGEEEEDEADA